MHRITLICHGATAATRRAAFPTDEPLEDETSEAIVAFGLRLRRADRVLTSPLVRARQTAAALELDVQEDQALRDLDHGRWAGRTIADVHATEPEAFAAWLGDDAAAPHGGETRSELRRRLAAFMQSQTRATGHTVCVTHAAVVRTVVLHVLDAPAASFWRIDVEPMSTTDVRFDGRRWALRSVNRNVFG
jgi:broad specificity phosphatase PhoE